MDKEISRLNEAMNREQELPEDKMERATDQHEMELERKYMESKYGKEITKEVGKDFDIDGYLAKRSEFITKVNKTMVEGKDYHVIQGKKSLAKGGAEKIASIFGWNARFDKDGDVSDALKLDGLIAFRCTLHKVDAFVGEGRGASQLAKNNSDPNKTIKMAQKSAFIDAVLRSSGLSDFFTQDLGPEDEGSTYGHLKPSIATGDTNKSKVYVDIEEDDINEIVPGNFPPPVKYSGITSMGKMNFASPKQIGFIKSLRKQKNLPEIPDDQFRQMTSAQASDIIKELKG